MKEHTRRQVDVLGIDVSEMRPDKAVNITMNYVNRKELGIVYFHSAAGSLYCQKEEWAAGLVQSCDLVLAGDRYMEDAVAHIRSEDVPSGGNGLFADSYIEKLFHRLNKDGRQIFAVMPNEDSLKALMEYMQSTFPDIYVEGTVMTEVSEKEAGRVVNEINGSIPDIVFICLDPQMQLNLIREYRAMMNTHLIICIGSLIPLVHTEMEIVPNWVRACHLTGIYQWVKKAGNIQEKMIGSLFRKSILEKSADEKANDANDQKDANTDTDQDYHDIDGEE